MKFGFELLLLAFAYTRKQRVLLMRMCAGTSPAIWEHSCGHPDQRLGHRRLGCLLEEGPAEKLSAVGKNS